MSVVLDEILAQAADQYPATVALSPESVTVLLYASGFLEQKVNWLDEEQDPLDEITSEQWDTIEKLVANLYEEVLNPLLGLIFPIMTASPPTNCLLCDGSSYAREDYPLLYDAINPVFIIDADTFFVPDLRSRVPVGAGTGTGLSTYAVNETGGDEAITLSSAQMPSHQHGIFTGNALALAPGELPVKIPSILATDLSDLAGGGGAHENRQPFVALNFAVVAQ